MKDVENFRNVLNKSLSELKMAWFDIACEDLNLRAYDVDWDDVSEYIEKKCLQAELKDYGFTDQEIWEILSQQMQEKTALKFMAYFISLHNEYETFEDFMNVIKKDLFMEEVEELDKETLESIFLSAHEIPDLNYVSDTINDNERDDM